MSHPIKCPKKLIEVALPLDAINVAAAREKSIRHGHPSTLHLWWARRPLAAARAVIFGQLVNDPSWRWELDNPGKPVPGHLKGGHANARRHLFKILEDLVLWENTTNEVVLEKARAEIRKSWRETCEVNAGHPDAATFFNPDKMPGLHDPFAGGGAIPLEAQRLGLEAYASDLNPVAVLINKAMIEIPPKFAGRPPVSLAAKAAEEAAARGGTQTALELEETKPKAKGRGKKVAAVEEASATKQWPGATGLAEDVRYYGAWMRAEAERRIGSLYPKVLVTPEMTVRRPDLKSVVGQSLTVIAWLWARTVRCPNPGCACAMPLLTSFVLSSNPGKEWYLVPELNGELRFDVHHTPPERVKDPAKGYKRGMSGIFECALCGTVTTRDYVAEQATTVGLGTVQTAIVVEGVLQGRTYLPAEFSPMPSNLPPVDVSGLDANLAPNPRDVWCRNFGLTRPMDLFTRRQLVALTTFSDLVTEARAKIKVDAVAGRMSDDGHGLDAGGTEATAYADGVSVYLAFAVDGIADDMSTLVTWRASHGTGATRSTFARQAIPMTWDFAEANVFSAAGDLSSSIIAICKSLEMWRGAAPGAAYQAEATTVSEPCNIVVSTDPPYYDNISYADLSDFFYVWLRRSLRSVFPALFSTIVVPKADELVATPYRHGNKEHAEAFFLSGMTRAMTAMSVRSHPTVPLVIYYAFKQSETQEDSGTSSTGWDTFLEAVNHSGLSVNGTWPMRTEKLGRSVGIGTNALASSIILVCRPRPPGAPTTSRRAFLRELNSVLPSALDEMTRGVDEQGKDRSPVAPVDLSQAIIGPGMAVFSKYAAVLKDDGTPMSVKTALELINRFLAEDDFDGDTQFCLHWFDEHGWEAGAFGSADVLARAKGTSVSGLVDAGVVHSAAGKVRLLRPAEYPSDWDPASDPRLPVWEVLHHLIRTFRAEGESGAGKLLAQVQAKADAARQLTYRLYTLCERRGFTDDARAYNELGTSWDAIETASQQADAPKPRKPQQGKLV